MNARRTPHGAGFVLAFGFSALFYGALAWAVFA